MADVTNPKIIRFVRGEEQRIKSFLDSILLPYESMVQEAIADFDRAVGTFGASMASARPSQTASPDFEPLKRLLGLKLPPSDATMRYSAKIKTEAIARLGFYSVIKLFKRILKKPIQNENEQEIQALGDGHQTHEARNGEVDHRPF